MHLFSFSLTVFVFSLNQHLYILFALAILLHHPRNPPPTVKRLIKLTYTINEHHFGNLIATRLGHFVDFWVNLRSEIKYLYLCCCFFFSHHLLYSMRREKIECKSEMDDISIHNGDFYLSLSLFITIRLVDTQKMLTSIYLLLSLKQFLFFFHKTSIDDPPSMCVCVSQSILMRQNLPNNGSN